MQPEGAVRHARNECDVDTVTRGNACLNFVKEIGAIAENAGADVACDGPAKERREVHLMESAYNAHQGIQVVVHLSREIPRTNVHGTAYDPRLGLWLTVSQRIELERDVPLAAQITARACDAHEPKVASHHLAPCAAEHQRRVAIARPAERERLGVLHQIAHAQPAERIGLRH